MGVFGSILIAMVATAALLLIASAATRAFEEIGKALDNDKGDWQ